MRSPVKTRLKENPHYKVEGHFMTMCSILPYGEWLQNCRIGQKVVRRINPTRLALLENIRETFDPDEFDYDDEWSNR